MSRPCIVCGGSGWAETLERTLVTETGAPLYALTLGPCSCPAGQEQASTWGLHRNFRKKPEHKLPPDHGDGVELLKTT